MKPTYEEFVKNLSPKIVEKQDSKYKLECLNCSKHFTIPGWSFRQGRGRFCCRDCWYKYKTGKYRLSEATKRKKRFYRGNKAPNWKGGETVGTQGYIMVFNSKHHNSDNEPRYSYRHRKVMEKKIGRPLKPAESVHHINGKKTDDRPENLEFFKNRSEHSKKYHHRNQYS